MICGRSPVHGFLPHVVILAKTIIKSEILFVRTKNVTGFVTSAE